MCPWGKFKVSTRFAEGRPGSRTDPSCLGLPSELPHRSSPLTAEVTSHPGVPRVSGAVCQDQGPRQVHISPGTFGGGSQLMLISSRTSSCHRRHLLKGLTGARKSPNQEEKVIFVVKELDYFQVCSELLQAIFRRVGPVNPPLI